MCSQSLNEMCSIDIIGQLQLQEGIICPTADNGMQYPLVYICIFKHITASSDTKFVADTFLLMLQNMDIVFIVQIRNIVFVFAIILIVIVIIIIIVVSIIVILSRYTIYRLYSMICINISVVCAFHTHTFIDWYMCTTWKNTNTYWLF